MRYLTMNADIAYAIGKDAGNRNMKQNGRTVWNIDDRNVSVRAQDKVAHLVPGWTPENPLR